MNLENRLDASIAQWNLLESPFYQAWNQGALPVESLRDYAHEYGAFISLIAKGWESHGDAAIAAEERGHVELWRRFAAALGTDIGSARTPAVRELVETADRLFSESASSIGALYAFEAQQPKTASTKLEGLRAHYDLPKSAEIYFEVHATDEAEPALLRERFRKLSAADQQVAAAACETMCRALRTALDALAPADCLSVQ